MAAASGGEERVISAFQSPDECERLREAGVQSPAHDGLSCQVERN